MALIKSIAAIVTIFAILPPLANAESASARLSENELSKLPSSAVKFVKYNRHLIDDLGYAGVKAISFEQTKKGMSLSAIIKDKKKMRGRTLTTRL